MRVCQRPRLPILRRSLRRALLAVAGAALILVGTACGVNAPSALDPAGTGARRVAGLWWLMFAIALIVCIAVIGLMLWAVARRRGASVVPRSGGRIIVVIAGVAVPAAILTAVYGVGLREMHDLQQPMSVKAVTIDVTGHRWWWEVRYPDSGVVTANEIHIPVGQIVHFRLRTADVIHSFWVPQLMPKTDLISGRLNETWLQADRTGRFRGQCAEYCGLQHAHMAFWVVVQSADDYQRWLTEQAAAAPGVAAAASDPLMRRGQEVIETASCASCHTVRGTTAQGTAGPSLSHVGSRSTLAAGTLPNTPEQLGRWISDSQRVKPGNLMPPQPLSAADLQAVVAFLEAGGGSQ